MTLVVAVTALATVSVVTGVDKGIKLLSQLNMGVAGAR
ncbi:BCCT family transporter [Nocardia tengchongensis]|uniref:BCCT family transporter n=1 Tax=Nocardia tengchongensis TaxID=2055889 RepID=A0ABX8CVG6_9NOCA|nr:BCCT family transporter [Nocardia tengchongensis]